MSVTPPLPMTDAVRALAEQERVAEAWLHGPVATAYDAVMDSSTELLMPEEVRAGLAGTA